MEDPEATSTQVAASNNSASGLQQYSTSLALITDRLPPAVMGTRTGTPVRTLTHSRAVITAPAPVHLYTQDPGVDVGPVAGAARTRLDENCIGHRRVLAGSSWCWPITTLRCSWGGWSFTAATLMISTTTSSFILLQQS